MLLGEKEDVITLLKRGHDVNETEAGLSPWIIAINRGDIKMVKILLEYGANPDVSDRFERTAFDGGKREQSHLGG